MRNLSVSEFAAEQDEMLAYVATLVNAGKIKYREDICHRLETIPAAFSEIVMCVKFSKIDHGVRPSHPFGGPEHRQAA
ncbi:hypothetical protein IVA78_26650 [Bradyrhizobium sp. 137]|uniref:hypothetical protein n=1 Tax=Bradyrhizobium sp. 137 TaxID=2782614 RepID=UPI001FF88024|nr:hypothetical protein [Bradyrhizobium sp. 137]MCK1758657.1 hypothetical protein [Bradyrhizobium sp. 137]